MYLAYGSSEPVMAIRLNDYDISQTVKGIIFGIEPLFYMIGTFLVPYIVPKWVELRITMITAMILLGVANVL